MKISMELYTLAQRFGDIKAMEMAKQAGFDAIDYSYYYEKECDEVLGEGYKEYAQKLRAHLDNIGLVCNQAHAPFSFKYGMKFDTSEVLYLSIVRAMESAAILGAENIVVHSISVPKNVDFEEYNLEFYKTLVPYCEKFGIHMAVENLFWTDVKRKRLMSKIGSPQELNDMVKKIDSPWVVACVDIGHASLTCCEPEEFIEDVNPDILKSLHVQDNSYLKDDHTIPYLGSLNWEAVMTSLKKARYTGDLTFEIVKFVDKFPDKLLPDAISFAASIGKYLVSIFEGK